MSPALLEWKNKMEQTVQTQDPSCKKKYTDGYKNDTTNSRVKQSKGVNSKYITIKMLHHLANKGLPWEPTLDNSWHSRK